MSTGTTSDFWEAIVRLPLSLLLAATSFVLISDYQGQAFWVLLAIHCALAVLIGLLVVRLLSQRLFLIFDEAVGRAFVFLAFFGLAHVSSAGPWLGVPMLPLLEPVSAHVIAWQNKMTGASVQQPVSSRTMSDAVAWVAQLKRRWDYETADDGGWDSAPMRDQEILRRLQTPALNVRIQDGGLQAELMVQNAANVEIESIIAFIDIGSVTLGPLEFVPDSPLLPGLLAPMRAPLPHNVAHQAVRTARGQSPTWVSDDLHVRLQSSVSRPFDRQEYIAKSVDSWLAD